MVVQWNLSLTDTIGTSEVVIYMEVSLIQRLLNLMYYCQTRTSVLNREISLNCNLAALNGVLGVGPWSGGVCCSCLRTTSAIAAYCPMARILLTPIFKPSIPSKVTSCWECCKGQCPFCCVPYAMGFKSDCLGHCPVWRTGVPFFPRSRICRHLYFHL